MKTYTSYYNKMLSQQHGFKLVLGGTGIGKTSAIPEVISLPENFEKKFIYIANRVQLINEMSEKLEELGIEYCHQKNDFDIIKELDIQELFSAEIVLKYIPYLKENKFSFDKISDVKRAYNFLSDKNNQILSSNSEGLQILQSKTSIVLRFLKLIISTAYQVSQGKIKINKYPSLSQNDFNNIIELDIIKQLFPYIDYKYNPKKRIFLVTLQKAFYGFFDGGKTVNLFNLDSNDFKKKEAKAKEGNGERIIFLDEFDFLENDILNLLTKDVEVQRPFEFVKQFYQGIKINKFPYEKFLSTAPEIKKSLDKVIDNIDSLKDKFNIDFPNICHFICSDKESQIRGTSIFQTRYSVSNHTFYLNEKTRKNSFDLTLERGGMKTSAFTLLDVVNRATSEIIRIFKELEHTEPRIYKELIGYCFRTSDIFQKTIKQVKQYPFPTRRLGSKYDKFQLNGFGLYEIHDLGNITDDQEVDFRYYALFNTPEKILWHICKNNFVFGLSATAEIPRLIKNFDITWLKKGLKEKYFEVDKVDIELIENANKEKAAIRKNEVTLFQEKPLNVEEVSEKKIVQFVKAISKLNDKDDFGNEVFGKSNWRKKRVLSFFSTLFWISKNRVPQISYDSHLLFFNSYRQIKFVLEQYPKGGEDNLFTVTKKETDNLFDYFEIEIAHQSFIIVFYNAAKARRIQNEELEKQRFYKLFWQDKPVLLISTYPSTGNGVNLQYFSSQKEMKNNPGNPDRDFLNIHLIDSPYYYFNPTNVESQTIQEQNSVLKANIYYLAKLEKSGIIHKSQFKRYLNSIRNSGTFNKNYVDSPDGILNQLAVFIQALGRIERVWKKMENQNIRLSKEVQDVFEKFLFDEELSFIRERVTKYFSNNMICLFESIKKNFKVQSSFANEYKNETISNQDEKCRKEIRHLLDKLNWVRKNPNSKKSKDIRYEWNKLRALALRHEFYKSQKPSDQSLLYKYHCVFQDSDDDYDVVREGFWVNKEKEIVPRKYATNEYSLWDLNSIYNRVRESTIVANYFDKHQYNYGFDNKGKYFVPYFFQCVLIGAIGEEALKAVFEWKEYNLPVAENEIPDELFELADTKVKSKPWYIDCKNYSAHTILHFPVHDDTGKYLHSKLNEISFKESALRKLEAIEKFHKDEEDCKLIYINVFGDENLPMKYLDENYNSVGNDFSKAKIIFIHSLLDINNPNQRGKDFELFIKQAKNISHANNQFPIK